MSSYWRGMNPEATRAGRREGEGRIACRACAARLECPRVKGRFPSLLEPSPQGKRMLPRTTERMPGRRPLLAATLLVAAALLTGATSARAQGIKTDTSLSLIPADAAFYASTLRNREQVELFLKSNAFKALRDLDVVKM